MPAQESDPPVGAGPDNPSGRMPENTRRGTPPKPPEGAGKQIARAPSGPCGATSPSGRPFPAWEKWNWEGPWGPFSCKGPQTLQIRLKYGVFRHLRMAAKGAAFGIRHLLKKVDENFAYEALRATAPPQQPAQRARVPAGAAPLEKGGRKLYLRSAAGENLTRAAPAGREKIPSAVRRTPPPKRPPPPPGGG